MVGSGTEPAWWRVGQSSLWEPQGMFGNATGPYFLPFDEWPKELQDQYRYDPENAEQLLDEAGYPRGADGVRSGPPTTTATSSTWASPRSRPAAAPRRPGSWRCDRSDGRSGNRQEQYRLRHRLEEAGSSVSHQSSRRVPRPAPWRSPPVSQRNRCASLVRSARDRAG